MTIAEFQHLHTVFTLPWTCEYSPSDGCSWFKGPDDAHEYKYKPSTFEAMVRATTSFLFGRSHVSYSFHNFLSTPWQRSQLDWSFLLDLLPHEKVVSDSCLGLRQRQCNDDSGYRDRLILFLSGECIEPHLNHLSLVMDRLVLVFS